MPTDRYQQLTHTPPGKFLAKQLGLPQVTALRRYEPGQPLLAGPALTGAVPGGRLNKEVKRILKAAGVETGSGEGAPLGAAIFDATGIATTDGLRGLYDFFHEAITKIGPSGRLIVLGTPPEAASSRPQAIAQRALEGFTRSAAKELRGGATGQLVYVAPGAEGNLEATLRFLLSAKSAYVNGQVVRIGAGESTPPKDWEQPLAGRVAVVTGASRGIGAAIADVLARDGAHVVGADIPAAGEDLAAVVNAIGGSSLALDVTADDAAERLIEHVTERHGGLDVIVHNAGITRDKTLARMGEDAWDMVLDVNLSSQVRINEALLEAGTLNRGGRIVSVSSIGGIAGNRGQTNYGASKAGVIGTVQALAPVLAETGQTINAVAPGFIETAMTAAMPLATREAGRRMNSLAQGGLPVDVAEAISWFASPGSGGVNGNVVRVCGQSLLGA
jgi:3-oxoacyl-[acyl-carrier protein] reductase